MRTMTSGIVMLTMLLMLGGYSVGTAAAQPGAKAGAMTVAELERAGDQARAEKDYALAIQYFKAALRQDRGNAVLYNKVGLSELQKGNVVAARTYFEKALRQDSKFADAVNNIGAVEYMRKNYGSAVKSFKKAVALDETRATYHVNLGAAWFSQKKLDRAIAEYTRALELDPNAFQQQSRTGIAAQIASPEERAQYAYLLAKIYAKRGDLENCLQCLRKAKEDGYRNLANVYKDEEFSQVRENPRLQEVVPPTAK